MTNDDKAYLKEWLQRILRERADFIACCKASGLKVNTLDAAAEKLR